VPQILGCVHVAQANACTCDIKLAGHSWRKKPASVIQNIKRCICDRWTDRHQTWLRLDLQHAGPDGGLCGTIAIPKLSTTIKQLVREVTWQGFASGYHLQVVLPFPIGGRKQAPCGRRSLQDGNIRLLEQGGQARWVGPNEPIGQTKVPPATRGRNMSMVAKAIMKNASQSVPREAETRERRSMRALVMSWGGHDQRAGPCAGLTICGQTTEQVVPGACSFVLRNSRQSCTSCCSIIRTIDGPQEECARRTHHRRATRCYKQSCDSSGLVWSVGI
jgi:hypothetical protein